ncbi:type II toxin-antitoxin system PemK/MazF family toxin [Paenibacillus sp. L3-i20]|uniref:type II toxin-antitoxin system PemK/MazF family toxin n=1 Tax=Paenibacillus sp. L3-i20 TaxID=2905833 RepID=UPI001EDE5EE2|nr:type II toxin-antitoxin system PemK/MazF family toxin [Paenibacillus sp. L3-i20]GKU79819.1 mRNA interferase [Paenibacillus sp. L3-i20]
MRRGEIWYSTFGAGEGAEQSGSRPVLIIQNDVGNEFSPTVIVAALTDSIKKHLPTHVYLGQEFGLKKSSVVMLEQLRTLDKKRLESLVGVAPDYIMKRIDRAIKVSLALVPVERSK